ncbi:hypothetical protein DA2_0832 [Desulfovibrio sp. A2]|nr:hypothetical protein DA2_0832 [Desulfovibrio sp. A2]
MGETCRGKRDIRRARAFHGGMRPPPGAGTAHRRARILLLAHPSSNRQRRALRSTPQRALRITKIVNRHTFFHFGNMPQPLGQIPALFPLCPIKFSFEAGVARV